MPIFKKRHDDDGSKATDKGAAAPDGTIILGCPRSGTTLLRRLLDVHPDISCPGETFLIRGCARFLEHDEISGGFPYGTFSALEGLGFEEEALKQRLSSFVLSFYEDMARAQGKNMWAVKTAVDSFYVPEIEYLFAGRDNIKFICVLRHGLDVVCSLKEFSDDLQSYIGELHDYICAYQQPYEAFARAWVDVTTDILDFADKYPQRCHVVRYEDLVAGPEAVMADIFAFLGREYEDGYVGKAFERKNIGGIGDWKSFKKTGIDKKSLSRWEKDMPESTVSMLAPVVNPVLERAGYAAVKAGDDEEEQRRREIAMMMMQADPDEE